MSEFSPKSTSQVEANRLIDLLASPVPTASGPLGSDVLWQRYFLSPYGVYMDDQPYRFSQDFGYDRQAMLEDMGMDVLPRDHQMQTGMFVAWILDREYDVSGNYPITTEERGIVILAALIHDMGETMHPEILEEVGAVVGDIPYGRKTDDDKTVEKAVRAALYTKLYADVSPDVIAQVEAIISHEDATVLHDIFEAAHCVQAFNTAVHTGVNWARHSTAQLEKNSQLQRDAKAIAQMQGLFTEVLDNMIPEVLRWSEKFAFIRQFADDHREIIAAH